MTYYEQAKYMQARGLCAAIWVFMTCKHCFLTSKVCRLVDRMTSDSDAFYAWRKRVAERFLKPVWAREVHK